MDKKEILKKLFWDRNVDIAYMLKLLEGKPERIPGDRIDLYRRFLTSHDWYTLLNLFPVTTLKDEILDEKVICRLFPKELRNRYRYARKILFVNDVKYYKGDIQNHALFHQIDNWCNILSNKLCALSRMDVKDIVDILFIAKKYEFNWSEVFQDAKEKDLWAEPLETCKILKGFPKESLNSVKWISPVNVEMLNDDIALLHNDIFLGQKNSLCSE